MNNINNNNNNNNNKKKKSENRIDITQIDEMLPPNVLEVSSSHFTFILPFLIFELD